MDPGTVNLRMALYVVPSLFLGTRYSIFQNFLVFLRIFLVYFLSLLLCHKSVWCGDIDKVSFRPFFVVKDRLRTRISINNIRDVYFVSRQFLRILLRTKNQWLVEPCMIQTKPHPKMIILSLSLCSLYYLLSSNINNLNWLLHAVIELLQHGLDIILVINFHKAESPIQRIVIFVVTSLLDVSPIYPYHYAAFLIFNISRCLFNISI